MNNVSFEYYMVFVPYDGRRSCLPKTWLLFKLNTFQQIEDLSIMFLFMLYFLAHTSILYRNGSTVVPKDKRCGSHIRFGQNKLSGSVSMVGFSTVNGVPWCMITKGSHDFD